MSTVATQPYNCEEANATQVADWLQNRGGILIWESVNLSNPGARWTTPALDQNNQPITKPNWQVGNAPVQHITDINDVNVITTKEVKRFHVATRASQGLSIKVTDGGTRKIWAEVAKAEEKYNKTAWYAFDYTDYENAVIMIEDTSIPMKEWLER